MYNLLIFNYVIAIVRFILKAVHYFVNLCLSCVSQVKTTAPDSYRVRPSSGLMKTGDSAEIQVYLQPGTYWQHWPSVVYLAHPAFMPI